MGLSGTPLSPKCVATTVSADGSVLSGSSTSGPSEGSGKDGDEKSGFSNYTKDVEWSPDGTFVVTNSADNHIRTFILPPDLLDERSTPHRLEPYSVIPSKEPVYSTALYPYCSLQDPSTTIILASVRDHPIRLNSALSPHLLASYSLICPSTEAFITPYSMLYPSTLGGTHFLTGSDSLICLFDVSRSGKDGPVSRLPTIPSKRKKIVGGGVGMKGIVSALSISSDGSGILAAGTFTRHVGLYGSNGSGDCIATFSVAGTEAQSHIGGGGVTQVLWSPCGRYLYVIERKSDGVLVYDIRVTGQLVGWLEGRKAETNQRLKADVVATGEEGTHELWAGGTDGSMRVWKDPPSSIDGKCPDFEWSIHGDPVTSTVVHPMGSVVATSSGQKTFPDLSEPDEGGDSEGLAGPTPGKHVDNTLKVWAL
ncbi:hypothetical protein FQN54_006672 [Arachnomyces sp. PD_36]|nr:hypothetical protein FQN54_006672 [Arachnomyces sp. PD_36]